MRLKEAVLQLESVKSDLMTTVAVDVATARNRLDQVITLLGTYPNSLANLAQELGAIEGAAAGLLFDSYNSAPDAESRAELALRIACKSLSEKTTALAVERTNNARLERELKDLRAERDATEKKMKLTSDLVGELLKVTS